MTETSSSQNTAVPEIFVSPQVLTVQQEFFLPLDNRTVEKEWTKMPLVMFFKDTLGGGFKYFFMFTPKLGDDSHFDEHIFPNGLVQPPTSFTLIQLSTKIPNKIHLTGRFAHVSHQNSRPGKPRCFARALIFKAA